MGQKNLKRSQFIPRTTVLNPVNSNVQEMDFVGYFELLDTVDVIDVDANGNIVSTLLDNAVIVSINPGTKVITLDQAVDTSAATGTPMIRVQNIDDGQEAIDRLYRRTFRGSVGFDLRQTILAVSLDDPSVGKATYDVADVSFFRAGDEIKLIDDNGVVAASAIIDTVNVNADDVNNKSTIVLTSSIGVTLPNNPYIQNLTIDMELAVKRNQERIDEIDRPIKNDDLGNGDGSHLAFETANLYLQNSTDVYLDGIKKKIGTKGTLGTLIQGSGDSSLTFTSLLLGTEGNKTTLEVVAGAGITVSVAGKSKTGYVISVTDNGGAATSEQIASAINADVDARRIVLCVYGGNGTGVVATFGPSNIAGGLNDGVGDYAEIEQVFENVIFGTGFKWVTFHIRGNERNRMNSAPDQDEEITGEYAKAHVNA